MVDVDRISIYLQTHSPRLLSHFEGWQPPDVRKLTVALHHKYCYGICIICYNI